MKKAFLVWQAVLAGLVVTAGGTAAVGDLVPEKYLGLFVLVVGGLQAATATYAHGLTQPSPAEVAAAERILRADAPR